MEYIRPTGQIFMKFDVCASFEKPVVKIQDLLQRDNNNR